MAAPQPRCSSCLQADPSTGWAAYIAGCLLVLATDGPQPAPTAARLASSSVSILVSSDVPEGKGVSSSASVEVATMSALAGCLGVALGGRQLAILCQKVRPGGGGGFGREGEGARPPASRVGRGLRLRGCGRPGACLGLVGDALPEGAASGLRGSAPVRLC